ncbi:hypothetical protein V494_02286 [Pseudogymnoascus sp. VKM F-4513 (FW-928)]|nr:hypothetical protein V494_02286 [Pseudogymnoascus sp. VKM F-4513 (FW-928)]
MRKPRHIAPLAIHIKILRHDGRNRHRNPHKAILINAGPHDIKPGQPAPRGAPDAPLPATALGEPVHRQHPRLDRVHGAEVVLLAVQRGRGVVAQQREEGGDREGFVAVRDDAEVHAVVVEPEGEKARHGVDGDHDEDADYAAGGC